MRHTLIVFSVFLLASVLYAQDKIIKFYFNDSNLPKEYKISDISKFNFLKSNLSYSIEIYTNGSINIYNLWNINYIAFIDSTKLKIDSKSSTDTIDIAQIDSIVFISNACTETVIGTQTWMCKNLDVTTYRNGDTIPEVTDSLVWTNLKTGAWCYYNNDPALGAIYGKLYNWYAVNDPRGLAPTGWHIPSDTEWIALSDYLGGRDVAGGKIKSRGILQEGTGLWKRPNLGATNDVNFTALPGGYRYFVAEAIGFYGAWWSSTMYEYFDSAWNTFLRYNYDDFERQHNGMEMGCSVRCVKD
jgi:uncharacterized protein (TIGR02145 family)